MKTKIIKLWISMLGLGLILQTGCALLLIGTGAAVGVGGYAYVSGELIATETVPLDHAWKATLDAMTELRFLVTSQAKDALSGHLICRTAKDQKVDIHLKRLANE